MKKIVFILMLLVVLVVNSVLVNAQCSPALTPPTACNDVSLCGSVSCVFQWSPKVATAVTTCSSFYAGCMACNAEPPCECDVQAVVLNPFSESVQAAFDSAQGAVDSLIDGGVFSSAPLIELNNCIHESIIKNSLSDFNVIKQKPDFIHLDTYQELLQKYPGKIEGFLEYNNLNVQNALMQNQYLFEQATTWNEFLSGNIPKGEGLNAYTNLQKWSILGDPIVADAMVAKEIELTYFNQIGVTALKLYNNPIIKAISMGSTLFSIASAASGGDDDDKDKKSFDQNKQLQAQNGINNALNSQAVGTSEWTNCPNHRATICNGKPVCVLDNKDGASQCIAALSGGDKMKVTFSSINVIDTQLNNMFTLTGSDNEGVVYQNDGFVNIDKGGTTKLSIAGEGVFVTDANSNQLYVGSGTTTYLGNGNEDRDTYLTNAAIYDFKSKVGVEGVNEIEQKRLGKPPAGSQKQAFELAVTFNKQDLKPYKNSIDIGKLQEHYQILARGFSNIILLENNKVFPLATRNYAKGDALIVKYKNVKISNAYSVNDENYEYTIKPIDDSTKVIAKNGKVIQDSGPFSYKLSKRESLLVYDI